MRVLPANLAARGPADRIIPYCTPKPLGVNRRDEFGDVLYNIELRPPCRGKPRYFELPEVQYFILRLVNGRRTARDIQQILQKRFSKWIEPREIFRHIDWLYSRGLLWHSDP